MVKGASIKERDILRDCKQVLDVLRSKNLLDYWRISTGGILQHGKHLVPNKEMSGFSDIIILLPIPRTLFVELKAESGRQSPNQKLFQSRVEAMNHRYYVCRSAENLCHILKMNGVMTDLFFRFGSGSQS